MLTVSAHICHTWLQLLASASIAWRQRELEERGGVRVSHLTHRHLPTNSTHSLNNKIIRVAMTTNISVDYTKYCCCCCRCCCCCCECCCFYCSLRLLFLLVLLYFIVSHCSLTFFSPLVPLLAYVCECVCVYVCVCVCMSWRPTSLKMMIMRYAFR